MAPVPLPLPTPASSPIDPRLDQAIARLELGNIHKAILRFLAEKDRDEAAIAQHLGQSARSVKTHLKVLESRGLVQQAGFVAGWGLAVSWIAKVAPGDGLPPGLVRL